MTEKATGHHELEPIPPVVLAQDLARKALGTSDRLRRLPIDSLEFAARITPFAMLRAPMAMTEAVLRRALLPDDNDDDDVTQSSVYPGVYEGQDAEAFTAPPDARRSVQEMVAELLDRSVRQSPRQADESHYKRLLLQLVPDEARILHALSNGEPRAMQHIGAGSMGGSPDNMVLRYASNIGVQAGVRRPEAVPDYLAHLVDLDLVSVGPEEDSLREQYEILDTFSEVEQAEEEAKSQSAGSVTKKLKLKTALRVRHSITISDLGAKLWEVANPDTHTFVVAEQRPEPEIDFDSELPPEPDEPRSGEK